MPDYTPALTLWPEWAWAIDLPHPLAKRVECRGYALPVGVWIYLHAGKHIGGRPGGRAYRQGLEAVAVAAEHAGLVAKGRVAIPEYLQIGRFAHSVDSGFLYEDAEFRPITTSAILGMFRVLRVLSPYVSEDTGGVRGWKVPDAYGNVFEYQRLNQPIPCKGAQGLWRLPVAVEMEIANVGFEVTNG